MPMTHLHHLLEGLFRLRGYDTNPHDAGRILRFTRADERVVVRVHTGPEPLSPDAAGELAVSLPPMGHGVVVTTAPLGARSRQALERAGIEVWTREKLVNEVGVAYVGAAEAEAPLVWPGTTPAASRQPPEPPTDLPAEPRPPVPTEEVAAKPTIPWLRSLSLVSESAHSTMAAPTPSGAPAVAPPAPGPGTEPATMEPSPPETVPSAPGMATLTSLAAPPTPADAPAQVPERILAAKVDEAQAMALATGRLMKVSSARLELVPRRVFRYRCSLASKGAFHGDRAGVVGVDAVSGTSEEVKDMPAFGPLPGPAQRLQALVPEDDASVAAKRRVIETHSQKVRQKRASNGAFLVQDVWVRPDPRSIHLETEGLWWVPVWHVEGHNGSIRVDATTGDVQGEKLKRAFATDAEFL